MYIKIQHVYILQMKSKNKMLTNNLMCFVTNKNQKTIFLYKIMFPYSNFDVCGSSSLTSLIIKLTTRFPLQFMLERSVLIRCCHFCFSFGLIENIFFYLSSQKKGPIVYQLMKSVVVNGQPIILLIKTQTRFLSTLCLHESKLSRRLLYPSKW